MSTRLDALLAALESWGAASDGPLSDDTSLIASGRLDSAALFNLLLWVEQETGRRIDPAQVDIVRALDTPAKVLRFIDAGATEPSPAAAVPSVKKERADDGYEVAEARPADIDDIARLQTFLWSPDRALNARRFQWKYTDSGKDHLVLILRHRGKVVGMRAFAGSDWEADGAPRRLFIADDLVIEPEHRGRGLFERLSEVAYPLLQRRGCTFFLSPSAMRVTRALLLAAGGSDLGTLGTIGRLSPAARLHQALGDLLARVPLGWRMVHRLPKARSAQDSFARLDRLRSVGPVIEARPRPQAMADLVRRLPSDGRLRVVRDADYLAWRFGDPLHEYRFVFDAAHDRLTGYLVLERALSPLANQQRVHIVDWEAETDAVAERLLQRVLQIGRFSELVTWRMTLSQAQREMVARAGFVSIDRAQTERGLPTLVVFPIGAAGPDTLTLGRRPVLASLHWDLRLLYTSYV